MPVFDLGNSVAVVPMHNPATYSADRTGASVDTVNFAYAFIVLHAGNIISPENVTFTIEHSETSGGTYEACKLLNSTDDAVVRMTNGQDDTCLIVRIDLNNTKRFIRANANHSASAGHTYAASMVLLPYMTDASTADTGAASAPTISI
jgi:hypothetical protein